MNSPDETTYQTLRSDYSADTWVQRALDEQNAQQTVDECRDVDSSWWSW